jgi:hypothetical protein
MNLDFMFDFHYALFSLFRLFLFIRREEEQKPSAISCPIGDWRITFRLLLKVEVSLPPVSSDNFDFILRLKLDQNPLKLFDDFIEETRCDYS